jgi:beta-lactamase regulating signal transducer with metallopeptidase domain
MNPGSDALWLAIGWTMLHFLWVGGLIGLASAMALLVLRRASAELRYGVALASLALLALAPVVIGWQVSVTAAGMGDRPVPGLAAREAAAVPSRSVHVLPEQPTLTGRSASDSAASFAGAGRAPTEPRPATRASLLDAVALRLPWLWMAGSPITFAWLALGLAGAERLRRRGARVSDGEMLRLCRRLALELGVARDVAIAVRDHLAAPVLLGVARPMILLPAAALAGWSPDQLEMVLLHELAHVRRWDNLVNLIQRLVESALFFHPAVWIVSGWVRREREHCCDGIVVARTGRARAYALTLLALADHGSDPAPRVALAIAANNLVARVRRILNLHREGHAMKLPRGLLALAAAILIFPAGWTITHARLDVSRGEAQAQARSRTEATDPEIDLRALVVRARELAEAAANNRRDPMGSVRDLLDLGASRAQEGDRSGGLAVLHRALARVQAIPKEDERVLAKKMLAERLALAGAADEAIAMASSLAENPVSGAAGQSATLHIIAWYLASDGHVAKAIEAARGIRDKELLGYALGKIADAQAVQGDAGAAMRTVESIEPIEARIRALVGSSSGREHPGLAVTRGRAGDGAFARECQGRARALTAALPEGPKKAEARASIALSQAQLGDVAEGLRQLRALSESNTRDTAIGQMALIQAQAGAWDDAYHTARSVPDAERRFFAIFELGEAQAHAGKRDLARQTFRKLLEANAGPKPLTTDAPSIARAQIYAGDLTAGLATIERMEVPDTHLIAEVAAAQAEAGDYSGARTTAAERIPHDAEKAAAYEMVAYYQAKAGQAKEALKWAESLDHRQHCSAALMGVATALAERRGVPFDQLQAPPKKAGANESEQAKNESPQPKRVADRPPVIQGKTVDEWLAALKDRDPAVREQAVEVLGERSLDPAFPPNERSKLQIAVTSLMVSDKDQNVRQAAAFFADLQKLSGSPERVKRALDQRKRTIQPTRVAIRLVDAAGQPVKGAVASSYFFRDADHEASFRPSDPKAPTSNAQGELALELGIPGHLNGAGVYAIRQDAPDPLVGLHKVTREQIRAAKPITIVMHPACRVRLRVECPGLRDVAEKYHADMGGESWWRATPTSGWARITRLRAHFLRTPRADSSSSCCRPDAT